MFMAKFPRKLFRQKAYNFNGLANSLQHPYLVFRVLFSKNNAKGGVGKTAAAVNLAYLTAQPGNSTLLCNLDPQGSASYYFWI